VFENRVLRRILGPKRDEVTGEWRKLHNEELLDLYSSPSIIRIIKSRRMRWAGHVARMGEERNAYRLLVGKPEGKRPLGRPSRWVDNISFILVGCILLRNVYINLLIIYLQSQLRVLFDVIISLVSQHVSAPLGHPQANHNILCTNIQLNASMV
jgi:hypothetical protein